MKIDLVHDIQKTYRTILSCLASPGRIDDLSLETALLDIECPINPGFFLLALTLLDAETTLSVVSENPSINGHFFSRMTNTRITDPDKSGFIFVLKNFSHVILSAQRGTLIDPHLGATIIMEVDTIHDTSAHSGKSEGRINWKLKGPGIKDSALLRISSRDEESVRNALRARNTACLEFPLGVDLLLMDARQRIVCIPRTTILEEM